eukprot:scaffold6634_cov229-Ochromonas_danica.AAC.4
MLSIRAVKFASSLAQKHVKGVQPLVGAVGLRRFSEKKSVEVPDSFYDETLESEKEFLEIATTLSDGKLENVTNVKNSLTWEEIERARTQPVNILKSVGTGVGVHKQAGETEDRIEDGASTENSTPLTLNEQAFLSTFLDSSFSDHLEPLLNDEVDFVPMPLLNSNMAWRKRTEFPNPLLRNFVADTDPDKYRYDEQGQRACPGKLQRKGKKGVLGCHKIDLDALHHLDIITLKNFLSEDGEILGRKTSGLCAKCQRKVAKTIKRARNFGILAHLGHYEVQSTGAALTEAKGDLVEPVKISKTINR